MHRLPALDLAILLAYLVGIVGVGAWFGRKRQTPAEFIAADRTMSGWAVGLSMFGSYISSISFLANPGKSLAGNWNPFVFSLATPLAAWAAVTWFVPFYRRSGQLSAYEHLENRFGPWARTYAVVCFLLTQMARMGTICYLLALAVAPLVGWDVRFIILGTGLLMTTYTVLGGIKAVIWTGVIQSIVLVAGPIICIAAILLNVPGGFGGVMRVASQHDKFSLGSFSASLTEPTVWVVFTYALVINLGNFAIDQSYVQRYITARNDREAKKSVWLTAGLYVPTAATFFFIGTALWALLQLNPALLQGVDAAHHPDSVFPWFIANALPAGFSGLVVAAIFAASMDSNLNSMATLTLCDIYKRYFRPNASERESMRVLHIATLFWGLAGIGVAIAMIQAKTILDVWWELAGVFSGGMLGLFLLGLLSRRTNSSAAAAGVAVGVAIILCLTAANKGWLGALPRPCHEFLVAVAGTLAILVVGFAVCILFTREQQSAAIDALVVEKGDRL